MSVEKIRKLVDSASRFTLEAEKSVSARPDKIATPLWELPAPITTEELQNARATPDCIVEDLLYADVGLLIAPGGTGKTTLILYMAVHIVLGIPLFELSILKPGPVLIITAEDSREMLVARLRAIVRAMNLNEVEKAKMMKGVLLSDVSGNGFRLTEVQGDVVKPGAGVDDLIKGCETLRPVLVVIDPAVSFGVGESRVNDAEQGLIEAARRLRRVHECCVLYIHHTGKQNGRERAKDQYAGRGGSAFADGSRMVFVLQNVAPDEWSIATGNNLEEGETGLVLARPKMSYCPPQHEIMISRHGYLFEHVNRIRTTKAAEREKADEHVFQFLTTQLAVGLYHTKSELDDHDLGFPRAEIRKAVGRLLTVGRIKFEKIPADKKPGRGGPHEYLHPVASPMEYGDHRS
ncbi:AAA family ATPase [Nitrosospira sp. Is2]|uniref:AAA family ATPase n=1 Tax=Nitrosospira sp. Is2 TaxID=3080532 RepID=UPI0029531909|nr:AAA family ATPase [Nitrosospira sp. Is2]WON75152.1 AAA family ATPase [Nitrosospira sp. Is2]